MLPNCLHPIWRCSGRWLGPCPCWRWWRATMVEWNVVGRRLLSSLVRPSRYNPSRLSSGQHLSGHSHRVLIQFGYQCTSILGPLSMDCITVSKYPPLYIDWCQNSSQDTVKCRVGKTATFHTIFLLYLLSANNSQLKNSIQSIKSVLIGIFSMKLIFQDLQAGPTHYWPPNTGHDAEK